MRVVMKDDIEEIDWDDMVKELSQFFENRREFLARGNRFGDGQQYLVGIEGVCVLWGIVGHSTAPDTQGGTSSYPHRLSLPKIFK